MPPRGKQIALGVLCAHGLLLIALLGNYWIDRPGLRRRPIAVRMVSYAPTQVPVIQTPVHVKPTPKKTAKVAARPKPQINHSDALLKQIAASLDSMTSAPVPSVKQEIAIPHVHIQLPPEEIVPVAAEQIAFFLREALQLPEYGEVKAHLVINRFGKLEALEILETKSEKNGQFLTNRLPELQFPCLNESTSLTVVFRNAL